MKTLWQRKTIRLTVVFILSLILYLAIAYFFHAPRGYYGTVEQPRFADPWIARSETILSGGMLYRDVFTSTPPITNFLLIIPSVVSGWFGHQNPGSTLAFMLFFSLFNLFTAFLLLKMGDTQEDGYWAALLFLLNPLTFSNTILRRQDESIVVFFIGIGLYFLLRHKHIKSSIAIGIAMLVKLTGAVLLPIAVLHSRKWHYFVIPFVVFFLILSPFLLTAGQDAMFWDFRQEHNEHPFQLGGVSLGALWNHFHLDSGQVPLAWLSILFVVGMGATIIFIAWKRFGILEDLTILIAMTLILSPKLHTGYFSMLAFTMAPLLKKYRLTPLYFLFGTLAVLADFYKWPIVNFPLAFWLMAVVLILLLVMVAQIMRRSASQKMRYAVSRAD